MWRFGACFVGRFVAVAPRSGVVGETPYQVIEAGEHLVGLQVQIGERVHGRAEPSHGGGGLHAAPGHAACHKRHPGPRQRHDIDPVTAYPTVHVLVGHLHPVVPGRSRRKQTPLQCHQGVVLAQVAAGVVQTESGTAAELGGHREIVLLERALLPQR